MKRGKLFISMSIVMLFLINIVSAQFYSGYGNFSPRSSLLEVFAPETVFYGGLFIILFALIFYSLLKFMRGPTGEHRGIAGAIAFAASSMAVYGIYWSRFDVTSLLPSSGFFYSVPSSIIPIISIVALIFMLWKFGPANSMIVFGLFAVAITFTDFVYEKGAAALIGILMIIVGIFVKSRGARAVAGGIAARKPKWVMVIAGIIIAGFGFLYFGWIAAIVGILIVALGIGGKRAYSETPLAQGRDMSKRRAENEAREENARRDKATAEKRQKDTQKLQQFYDHQKSVYLNKGLPKPTRKAAAREMQKIIHLANSQGLKINP